VPVFTKSKLGCGNCGHVAAKSPSRDSFNGRAVQRPSLSQFDGPNRRHGTVWGDEGESQAAGSTPSGAAPQKGVPISVFVNRKLSRLFVRQGFTSLFDVPVEIQNPEEPLGTHVFTVMESQNEGSAVRWNVVSIPEQSMSPDSNKERKAPKQQVVEGASPAPLSGKANAALDRIEIPQDTVEHISELLTAGSSLIISDYGISSETGPDTNFIVLTH
jgi:hypothetical protein